MSDIEIEIDGNIVKANSQESIISIADREGIEIPRFCYHKKLSISANCRMCLVDIDGMPKPQPACSTMAAQGMKISTTNKKTKDSQKAVMEFLLINHPLDCPICDQGGECELQDVAMEYGSDVSKFSEGKRIITDKDIGPLIQTDMTRCIHCTRCVRFGVEVAGITEMGGTGRGENTKIEPFLKEGIKSELSGNMIDVCPVGALTSKPFRYEVRSWQMHSKNNVARHDLTGSNIFTQVHKGKIKRVVANDNEKINETWISDRDRFSYEGLQSENRLTKPKIKIDNNWQDCEWDEALKIAVKRIQENKYNIGALASNTATLEEFYLLKEIMQKLDCNNFDSRLNVAYPSNDISYNSDISLIDLGNIDYALIIGSYLRLEQPMINHRIKKAKKKGAKVSTINIANFEFNYDIDDFITSSPQDTLKHLLGVLKAILKIKQKTITDNLKDIKVSQKQEEFANYLCKMKKSVLILGEHINSNAKMAQITQTAYEIAKIVDAKIINVTQNSNFMAANKVGFAKAKGLNAQQMLSSDINTFLLFDVYPQFDFINAKLAINKFNKNNSFVIAFNSFRDNNIEEIADIILPIASFYETSGTHINIENIAQTYQASINPLGNSKPGWKILKVLADLLELEGFQYKEIAEITKAAMLINDDFIATNEKDLKINDDANDNFVWQYNPYTIDAVTRNSPALQNTDIAKINEALVSEKTAKKIKLKDGDLYQGIPVKISSKIADECFFIHTNQARKI